MDIAWKRTTILKIKTCSKDAAGRMFCLTNLRRVALPVILESLLHVCDFLGLLFSSQLLRRHRLSEKYRWGGKVI